MTKVLVYGLSCLVVTSIKRFNLRLIYIENGFFIVNLHTKLEY